MMRQTDRTIATCCHNGRGNAASCRRFAPHAALEACVRGFVVRHVKVPAHSEYLSHFSGDCELQPQLVSRGLGCSHVRRAIGRGVPKEEDFWVYRAWFDWHGAGDDTVRSTDAHD